MNWFSMYEDLPSKQLKVTVVKRDIIQVTWDERRVTSPVQLQVAIDEAVDKADKSVGKIGSSRAFVRPSGTENSVRIYAESYTHEATDWLSTTVAILTYQLAGGIGSQPTPPRPLQICNESVN
nr:SJCHGC03861 protein [Schistosoma japonicum]